MGIFDAWKKKKKGANIPQPSKKAVVHAHHHDQDKQKAPEQKPKRVVRVGNMAHAVLLRPHVSEKSAVQEAFGSYTFVVRMDATKPAVKQAVKDIYGVLPTVVRMVNTQGKWTRMGRGFGRRSDWKKAIVTLPKGQSIRIHEGV